MKTVTLRLPDQEQKRLQRIKDLGFSSQAEVIRCATLGFCEAEQKRSATAKAAKTATAH